MQQYELREKIGQGGMGLVYKAYDPDLDRTVAIKFMDRSMLDDAVFVERFLREARLLAKIDHPNVVHVYGAGKWTDGTPYFAMELLEGTALSDRIRQGPIPDTETIEIARQALAALDAVHKLGVVHRDIKSNNILLGEGNRVKLIDFGIARNENASFLTSAGKLIGTPAYMSPEQALGETVGPESDLYSLGIVIYEMLTGKAPFRADSPVATAKMHVDDPLPPLPKSVSPHLVSAVYIALQKNPSDRFASAQEMSDALNGATPSPNRPKAKSAKPPIPPSATKTVAQPAGKSTAKKLFFAFISLFILGVVVLPMYGIWMYVAGRNKPDPASPVRIPVVGPVSNPSWSPDGRNIVFDSKKDGVDHVFVTDLKGSMRKCLTEGIGGTQAAWGRNGKILFVVRESDKAYEIYVMNEDGTDRKKLTKGNFNANPCWGENGKILFSSIRDGKSSIFSMDENGSNVRRLTSTWVDEYAPSVGPNGKIAFYATHTTYMFRYEIYVMDADGANLKKLEFDGVSNMFPTWGPDGRIAFTSSKTGRFDLFVSSSDGANVKKVETYSSDLSQPSWGPGGRIAYVETSYGERDLLTILAPPVD